MLLYMYKLKLKNIKRFLSIDFYLKASKTIKKSVNTKPELINTKMEGSIFKRVHVGSSPVTS